MTGSPWGDPGIDCPDPLQDEHGLPRAPGDESPDFLDLRPLHPDDSRNHSRRWAGLVVTLRHHVVMLAAAVVAWWRSDAVRHHRGRLRYRVRQAPRDIGRLVWFAVRGHGRWIGKAWSYLTYADLRADARTARASGDPQARREAQELIRADSRARWARIEVAVFYVGRVAVPLLGTALLLWLLDSVMSRDEMWPWLAGLYDLLDATVRTAVTLGPVLGVLAGVGWLVAATYEGRDRSPGAGWLSARTGRTRTRGSTSG